MPFNVGGNILTSTQLSYYNNTNIVRNNLVFYADATLSSSYPGSGTAWYDISGYGTVLDTQLNAPYFTSVGGVSCFDFTYDSVSRGFTGTFNGPQPATDATIDSWIYVQSSNLTGADRGCIVLQTGTSGMYQSFNLGNDNLSNYWYDHPTNGYHEAGVAITRLQWTHVVSVWNYSTGILTQYLNGSSIGTFSTQGNSAAGNSLRIGLEQCCGTRTFPGYISTVRIYNAALTASQVLQNYQATRVKFGR